MNSIIGDLLQDKNYAGDLGNALFGKDVTGKIDVIFSNKDDTIMIMSNNDCFTLYLSDEDLVTADKRRCSLNNVEHTDVLKDCTALKEYKRFVDTFRYYSRIVGTTRKAADATIEKCLEHGVLEAYLENNKDRVEEILSCYEKD